MAARSAVEVAAGGDEGEHYLALVEIAIIRYVRPFRYSNLPDGTGRQGQYPDHTSVALRKTNRAEAVRGHLVTESADSTRCPNKIPK